MTDRSSTSPSATGPELGAALTAAGLDDVIGTHPDLVRAQLRAVIGDEPVTAALVLSDAAVDESGMRVEVQVAVLTGTRLVYFRGTPGTERVGDERALEDAVALRPAFHSQTRVIPLRSVLETRITQTAFHPADRPTGCPNADLVSAEVLTAELGSVQIVTETCAECDCGTAAHTGDFRQYPVVLVENEETPEKIPSLIAFVTAVSMAIATR